MSIAAPPEWVLALQLDPGAWRLLVGLWTYADYDAAGEQVVGPSRERLAARIGVTARSVRRQLVELRTAGWIADEHGGRFGDLGIRLAWSAPFGQGRPLDGQGRQADEVVRNADKVDRSPDEVVRGQGRPVSGQGRPLPPDEVDRQADEVVTQTLQDLAEDLAIDLEAKRAAHLAIVEQQADLAAKRAAVRAETEHDPRRAVTREHVSAVNSVGTWAASLVADAWERSLGECIQADALTPEQVAAVLRAWDAAVELAGGPLGSTGDDPRRSPLPTRRALWWDRWRPWRLQALGIEQARPRDGAKLSAGWAANTPRIPLFDGEATP